MTYDVIVRNGLWFDGTGAAPQVRSLGIRDGIVAEVSATPLDETGCPDVIDAAGKWIVPGFIDVHTHYDAEVLLDPGLRESVRHGVTTVLLGNCSLSTVYADTDDAADLFSRVEAVPRSFVHGALEAKTWSIRPVRPCHRRSAARPECGLDAGTFGPSDQRARPGPRDDRRREADPGRTGPDDGVAREGARRRTSRPVRHGRTHRQTRRRSIPVAGAAFDVRHLARAPQADLRPAQARPHSAERAQHQEPGLRR